MVCSCVDLLINLSTIMAFVLLLARRTNFTFIEDLALRYLKVNKGHHDKHCCQDECGMLASDTSNDIVHPVMSASASVPDGTAEPVKRLVRGVSFQAPEPMTPSTDDGADYPPLEQSSDGSGSEAEPDVCEKHSRPRAISAPLQSQPYVASASDLSMCQNRNRSRTVSALSQSHSCERQVNSILNKLTRERFENLYQQLFNICKGEDFNQEIIHVIARGVFAKATVQHTFAEMYAEVCCKLYRDFAAQATKPGIENEFRRSLLEQCQNSFEIYLQRAPVDASLSEDEQFEQLTKYKTRMLGNVRLIAHLIRQKIISSKIIFDCTGELLKVSSIETLESLCTFVSTLGDFFNAPEWHAHVQLLVLFSRIRLLSEDPTQSSRIRFLMKNVLDQRSKNRLDGSAFPPLAPKDVKSLPVLLGRTGSVGGGGGAVPTSEEIRSKEPEKTKDESANHLDRSHVYKQKTNENDMKTGQELTLPVPMDCERTPLRITASPFQPVIPHRDEPIVVEEAPKTSIMLRNIPADFSRSAVLDVLRSEGFADQIAFIYVPMNLRSKGNFGYAFVDFDSRRTAERCKEQLEGFTQWAEQGDKALEIAWSDTQGLDAQIARYRDSPLMHESVADEMKPALYKHGTRVDFPAPTKTIRAPRLRKVVEPVEPNTQ